MAWEVVSTHSTTRIVPGYQLSNSLCCVRMAVFAAKFSSSACTGRTPTHILVNMHQTPIRCDCFLGARDLNRCWRWELTEPTKWCKSIQLQANTHLHSWTIGPLEDRVQSSSAAAGILPLKGAGANCSAWSIVEESIHHQQGWGPYIYIYININIICFSFVALTWSQRTRIGMT